MTVVPTEPCDCPVCGPAASKPCFLATDRLHGQGGEYAYRRCGRCGLLYMNPRVRPDVAGRVYPANYAPHATRAAPTRAGALARTAFRWLRGTNLPRQVTSTLGASARVLDVGCGAGEFLNELRERFGCAVEGLDVAQAAVQAAKDIFGIHAFCGTLADAPWSEGSFDLVTAWWSLEHLADPERALAKIHGLLKDDGHCVIAVPNSRSLVASLFRDRWYHLDCPRHYHLWTPASLRQLLERCGLVHVSTSFDKTPWGLLGSLQYLIYGNNFTPKTADRLRGNVFLAPALLPLTFGLGMLRYSDTMVVCVRKGAAANSSRCV